jgi:hypothetical protein
MPGSMREVTVMVPGCNDSSPELIYPFGGPDEEDPDLHPDPTADDPPFGDEPEDDDGDEAI